MKIRFSRLPLLVLPFLLAGCVMHTGSPRPTIPLVERIINDTQSPEYKFLSRYDASDSRGDIVILDAPARALALSERLVACDDRDNVDGKPAPDQLPDFAGERIVTILDIVYPPYARFVEADNANALREVTVRAAINAVDTACCLGPFDHERRTSKPSAKLLILSSPYMAAFGGFDIDTLFRSTGAFVPVISVPEAQMACVLDGRSGAVNIGILSDPQTAQSGVYQTVFKELARKRQDTYSTVTALSVPLEAAASDSSALSVVDPLQDGLKQILDEYSRAGKTGPLSALVVDDYGVCVDSLRSSYRRILNRPSEENAFYRKMLAKDFEILDGARIVTDACYRLLREKNLFTHNIAYPVAAAYITSPEAPSYMLMDFELSSLPAELMDEMQRTAPITSRLYVQDQYHTRGN